MTKKTLNHPIACAKFCNVLLATILNSGFVVAQVTEPKPEAKVEAKPETKTEAKAETKTESKPEVKNESKPEPKIMDAGVSLKQNTVINFAEICEKTLSEFPGKYDKEKLKQACAKTELFPECSSVNGVPIYHYNRIGTSKDSQKILVFSVIHGDEVPAGSVGRYWMERLESIDPRNTWRVVPVLNPDGLKARTRTNANKVDVNRNFPTKDWDEKALNYWKKDTKSNPRRFPGNKSNSEPETQCALRHLDEFKPDFVVSVHTPLKVLDFDGPKIKPPKFDYLPWKSLGHYPGSLGRYMWFERKIPVLTMELKEDLPNNTQPWIQLQDIIGLLVGIELKGVPK